MFPVRGDDAVFAYKVDPATGAMAPVNGSPFEAGDVPLYAAADPSGKFLYVTNAFSSDLSAFTIDLNTGSLASIAGSPFSAGGAPIALAVDPSTDFLFVTRSDSTMFIYRVGSTGGLSVIAGSPFGPTGTEPRAIAIVGMLE